MGWAWSLGIYAHYFVVGISQDAHLSIIAHEYTSILKALECKGIHCSP